MIIAGIIKLLRSTSSTERFHYLFYSKNLPCKKTHEFSDLKNFIIFKENPQAFGESSVTPIPGGNSVLSSKTIRNVKQKGFMD